MSTPPPIPTRPPRNPDTGGSADDGNPVIGQPFRRGTSAYTDWLQTNPNLPASQVPMSGARTTMFGQFRPYRTADLNRILLRLVNQGAIIDFQRALVAAGLLDEDVNYGVILDETRDAFSDVLAMANQNGLAWEDVMSMLLNDQDGPLAGAGPGAGGAGVPPTIIELPLRDDVVAAAEDTGLALTGQRLDDDLNASIADHVLNQLRTMQERQFQLEQNAAPGSLVFTEGPGEGTAQRLLEEEVERRDPGGVMGAGARDTVDTLLGLLEGPV